MRTPEDVFIARGRALRYGTFFVLRLKLRQLSGPLMLRCSVIFFPHGANWGGPGLMFNTSDLLGYSKRNEVVE